MSLPAEVMAYYARGVENTRHATYSRLEYLRLQIILKESLPPPPAHVLDVGGGSGIWATHLQREGYDVVTTDLLEPHARLSRASGVRNCAVADARDLPFATGRFDAVLMLGPLYHLVDQDDRVRALRECRRTTKGSGVLIAGAISRYAMLLQGWMRGQDRLPGFEEMVRADLRTGLHSNPTGFPSWFTTAYLHQPSGLRDEVFRAGWRYVELRAVQGFGHFLANLDDILDEDARRAMLLSALAQIDRDPDMIGTSGHIAAVARNGD